MSFWKLPGWLGSRLRECAAVVQKTDGHDGHANNKERPKTRNKTFTAFRNKTEGDVNALLRARRQSTGAEQHASPSRWPMEGKGR